MSEGRARRPRRRQSAAKAVSWRVLGSLDTLVLSFVILTVFGDDLGMNERTAAANAKAAGFIATAEVFTKIALYYLHERLWARLDWGVRHDARGHPGESRRRSFAKMTSWRVLASLDTALLALLFTGSVGAALSIGGLEVGTKLVLYYLHERLWQRCR